MTTQQYFPLEYSSSENLSPSVSTVNSTKKLLLYQLKSKYLEDYLTALYFYKTWLRKILSCMPDFTCWGNSLVVKFFTYLKYGVGSRIISFS